MSLTLSRIKKHPIYYVHTSIDIFLWPPVNNTYKTIPFEDTPEGHKKAIIELDILWLERLPTITNTPLTKTLKWHIESLQRELRLATLYLENLQDEEEQMKKDIAEKETTQ